MMIKKKKEILYRQASKVALENSKMINAEARILNDKEHYARGFALSVISLEESSKAFLFRLISHDVVDERKTMNFVHNHESKLLQSTQILAFGLKLAEVLFNAMKIAEAEGKIPNISSVEDYQKNIELWTTIFENMKKFFHKLKLDSLYVDVREGKIMSPSNFTKTLPSEIIGMADLQINIIETLMDLKDSQFLDLLEEPTVSQFLKINHILK